jgi:Ca-activated chloride channel family protein
MSLNLSPRLLAVATVAALLVTSLTLFGQSPDKGGINSQYNIKPGEMPQAPPVGDPVALKTKEGKTGWKLVIPGGRPLATPAVVEGKVFLGGGFGSHEFYAFDAKTGKQVWLYRTGDDGPTAAVVEDGHVAFNTESCELEILTMDGKRVWKKWLGDPLMSMPAISKGRVYMAYPDSKGDRAHKLACFDIKDGKEQWTRPIAGEIITAPVVQNDKIYLTTLDGTVYCFHEQDGSPAWSEKKNATSSPAVLEDRVYFSQRLAVKGKDKDGKDCTQQMECLAGRDAGKDGKLTAFKATERVADYLDWAKRVAGSKIEKQNKDQDAGVGFGSAPKAARFAEDNLGQGTVVGVWSFQGSRPFFHKGHLVTTMGDTVQCLDPTTEKVLWKKELHPPKKGEPLVDCAVTPPAVVNGKLFVGTSKGEVFCLSADTGEELWRATVGEPIGFQPAVAQGRVYVASLNGSLFCIETGDAKDDGWRMWGGNAQHNGVVK